MLREKENVTVLLRSTWAVCVSDTDPNGLSTFAVIGTELLGGAGLRRNVRSGCANLE